MAFNNTPTHSSLVMDRSSEIGNSPGDDDRGRLHVKVSNKQTEPIPVTITDSEPGDPFFLDASMLSTPGIDQTLLSYTVPVGQKLYLSTLSSSLRIEGFLKVLLEGSLIGSARSGAAKPDVSFTWSPRREVLPGETVQVVYRQRASSPIVEIAAHLMGLTINT